MNPRWYERPWQRVSSGPRASLAASLYLFAGLTAIVLAAMSGSRPELAAWTAIGLVMIGLGTSLGLTLRRRRS